MDHFFQLASATHHIWFQTLEPTSSATPSLHPLYSSISLCLLGKYLLSGFWNLLQPPRSHPVGSSLFTKTLTLFPLLEDTLFPCLPPHPPRSCLLSPEAFLSPSGSLQLCPSHISAPSWRCHSFSRTSWTSLLPLSSHFKLIGTPS